jgi:hypothetical protein
MSKENTPGQIAYEGYEAALPERAYFPAVAWLDIHATHQRAWEAAAQAVLAQGAPRDEPSTPKESRRCSMRGRITG